MAGVSIGKGAGRRERKYPLMTRRQIEGLIAEGRHIVIVDQYVLKLDAWMPYHPGGMKSIQHMVGRDATDEVTVLHSEESRLLMHKYRVGRVEGYWKNFLPPIQGGEFRTQDSTADLYEDETGQYIKERTDSDPCSEAVETACDSDSSSRSSSPPPIFDDNEDDEACETDGRSSPSSTTKSAATLSRRQGRGSSTESQKYHRSTSPCTKASSVDGCEAVVDNDKGGAELPTAFLDTRTREEIRLDLEKYPSLDAETQHNVVTKFRELDDRIHAAGLFECDYTAYAWETSRYLFLFVSMIALLRIKWYYLSAFCLGGLWHQLVFTVHDAGHMGITHSFFWDTLIGILIADFIGGLSVCWWKDNHNVHHIVTNSPEHDPDIEHMPFFAVSHRLLQNLRSTYYERIMEYDAAAKIFLSFQSWSYYPILCFGRFNLYRLSWMYIILGRGPRKGAARWHRWLEAAGQVFFWIWFGYFLLYRSIDTNWHRFVYVMISHVVTMPLHVQITLSHFAMSTAELGPAESFPQRMLRTTMDVDCPRWLDFFHGGLQFQAIHHLYPRMPRHNLRKAQKMVQEFCDDVNIPYALYGFVDGNKEVIGRLADVSRQAAILSQCQQALAEGRA